MRITLADAKAEVAAIPQINLSAADPRIVNLINRAQRRLIELSRGQLLQRRIRLCVDENCVTAPHGVATLTDAALSDDILLPIRNEWYEFLDHGGGVYLTEPNDSHGPRLLERGETCLFRDIVGVDKRVKIYTDVQEATGTYLYLQGFDQANRWVRTEHDGSGTGYHNGERIDIGGAGPFYSTSYFSAITHVSKPVTEAMVRLYEYQPSTGGERLLAFYEFNETAPSYQRYLIRGTDLCQCDGVSTLTAIATMEFVPAAADTDNLVVPSMEALITMCEAIKKEENNVIAEGLALSQTAVQILAAHRDKMSPRERINLQVSLFPKNSLSNAKVGSLY